MIEIGEEKLHAALAQRAARTLSKALGTDQSLLSLEKGEFDGPALIDRPLHLRGHGRGTVLWSYEAPVVIVASAGVIFENLLFDVSTSSGDAVVLYFDGCEPEFRNCLPKDVKALPMSAKEEVINLGKLKINTSVDVPVILPDTPNGYVAQPPTNSAIRPLPKTVPSRRGFNLALGGFGQEGVLIDNFTITPKQGGTPSSVLLYATIERSPAQHKIKAPALRVVNSQRLIHIGNGIELTDVHLRLTNNGSFSGNQGLYAYVFLEDGQCILWIPHDPPSPIKTGGKPIPKWRRVVLEKGQRLDFAGTEIVIEDDAKSPLKLPSEMHLTYAGDGLDSAELSVSLSQGWKNLFGMWNWEGQVVALLPHLNLPNTKWTVKSPSTLTIPLSDAGRALDNGEYRLRDVIALYNDKDVQFVTVLLTIAIPDHNVQITPTILPFVTTSPNPLYVAEVSKQTTSFIIQNRGRKPSNLAINPQKSWLMVADGARQFSLDPGRTAKINVTLTTDADTALPEGVHDYLDVLRVIADGNPTALSAHIELLPARRPVLNIAQLSDKTLTYNLNRPAHTPKALLKLENTSATDGVYQVKVDHPTLDISPSEGIAPAKSSVSLSLTLSRIGLQQMTSPQSQLVTLVVYSGRTPDDLIECARVQVTIEVVDLFPLAVFRPSTIPVENAIQGQTVQHRLQTRLHNEGTVVLNGTLRHLLPNVYPSVRQITLAAGASQDLTVELKLETAAYAVGVHTIDILEVEGDEPLRKPAKLSIRIMVERPQPLLKYIPMSLWAGRVVRGHADKVEPITLVIENYGHAPWIGQIQTPYSWLYLAHPSDLTVPPKTRARLTLQLTEDIDKLQLGPLTIPDAVQLRTALEVIRIPARIIVEDPTVTLSTDVQTINLGKRSEAGSVPLPVSVTVTNEGLKVWQAVQDHSRIPEWIAITGDSLSTPIQGQSFQFTVSPKLSALQQPGKYEGNIILSDGSDSVTIPISLEVVGVSLRASAPDLHFYKSRGHHRTAQSTLSITNTGSADFEFHPDQSLRLPDGISLIHPRETKVITTGSTIELTFEANPKVLMFVSGKVGDLQLIGQGAKPYLNLPVVVIV